MDDFRQYANSPILWVFAFAVVAVICVQALSFYRLARQAATEEIIRPVELKTAMRAGAISAIGPSLAVAVVAISLLPVFGTPVVLMRIGMVGAVAYELAAANAAAQSMGVELGGQGYDGVVFATVFFVMALGASIWMFQVLFLTKSMGKVSARVSAWNPWVMAAVTGGALLGAFAYLTISQAIGGLPNIIVLAVSGLTMLIIILMAQKFEVPRLKEWALGIAILAGLISAYAIS